MKDTGEDTCWESLTVPKVTSSRFIYTYTYEQDTSVCMCCTVTKKTHTQSA